MLGLSKESLGRASGVARQRIADWLRPLHTCRACGLKVRPWENVCPHCGTGSPVEVPLLRAILWVTAIGAVSAIALWVA